MYCTTIYARMQEINNTKIDYVFIINFSVILPNPIFLIFNCTKQKK